MKGVNKVKGNPNKPWRVQKKVGEKVDGSPILEGGYFKTKAAAEREAVRIQREVDTGEYIQDTKITLREHLEDWMAHKKAKGLAAKTIAGYRSYIGTHILPELGKIKLSKLTTKRLRKFLDKKLTDGRVDGEGGLDAGSSVRHIYVVINNSLKQAVDEGLLRKNPMDGVNKPTTSNSSKKISNQENIIKYDESKVARLIKEFQKDNFYGCFFELILHTGLRLSEARALQWQNVNFEKGIIKIKETMVNISGNRNVVGTPKSEKSKRDVRVGKIQSEVLCRQKENQKQWKEEAQKNWTESDLVFTTKIGTPPNPSNIRSRHLSPIFDNNPNLPKLGIHDLRHLHVTMSLNKAEIGVTILAEQVGHSSPAFTLERYSHLMRNDKMEAAIKYDKMMSEIIAG